MSTTTKVKAIVGTNVAVRDSEYSADLHSIIAFFKFCTQKFLREDSQYSRMCRIRFQKNNCHEQIICFGAG